MNPIGKLLVRAMVSILGLGSILCAASAGELLPPGFRPLPPGVHALVGGKIVVRPGEVLDPATIVIRGGVIQAVGANAQVPADARVWDMKGATIYAGFIEPYLVVGSTNPPISTSDVTPISGDSLTSSDGVKFFGAPGAKTDMGNAGPGSSISRITPEFRAIERYSPDDKTLAALRELGFTTAVIAPGRGIIRGTSALVTLVDENPNRLVLRPDVFQHAAFDTRSAGEEVTFPGSLMGVIAAIRQAFFDAQHYALDHADFANHSPGRPPPDYDPSLAALAPAANRRMRLVLEPGSALMDGRATQLARELGFDFALISCGQEWRRPDLAKAAAAPFIVPLDLPTLPDLPNDEDWDQVSLDQLRAWDWAAENPALLLQQGLEVALTTYGLSDRKKFRPNLRLALDRGLSETDALAALTTVPAKLCGVENQLGTIEPGKLANLTVVDGTNYFHPDLKVRAVWIEGRIYPSPTEEPKAARADEARPSGPATNAPAQRAADKREEQRQLRKTRLAHSPMEGRGPITNPPSALIRNVTIWTCGPQGILTNAQLLISGGKIRQVGIFRAELAAGTLVIDGAGLHITPGIVDCHSHSFVLGAVNEMTLPSTAMVRIGDVINSETDNLYEQLAGGVTAANVLHGSANPIGGQNCVVKLRDGATPDELIFSSAPSGIKFALGENVKQSNWGDRNTTRFPQTRMGVRAFTQNRFTAAQDYLRQWENYRKATNASSVGQASSLSPSSASANGDLETGRMPVPPRRDLELEALGEILQAKRWIHCHGYRQDEMLALLRLMQGFGVQIATFQHVLEGYKIADELAAANVGGSAFSDWWAYKFEVYDAIPHNGSLMRDRGVVVSFNSDSSDLARRLYLEAAKAVKYGGASETEALKFVTFNPAKQLRIDPFVGSLEPGKDADFVIWSKAPLDSGTVCLQTWIDGKKYFDRSLDDARTARLKKERDDLLAKAKKLAKPPGGEKTGDDDGKKFFQQSLEHEFDGQDRHCLDEVEGGR